jgi:site-specific recombinase XerD
VVQHPALRRAGGNAEFAADEFFSACVSNEHTRRAYGRAVGRFLDWCESQGVALSQVSPGAAGRFIEELPGTAATKNQSRAALKQFCDRLVQRHAMALNPFATVRSMRYRTDGKTPEITIRQARELLASVGVSTVTGLRDRAVLGTLIYTGARVGAVSRLRRKDLQDQETQQTLRFLEKNGKDREIPVRHDLGVWLSEYLSAARIEDPGAWLYQAALPCKPSPRHLLSGKQLSADLIRLMVKRRLKAAGLPATLRPHSFRVLVVTDLLAQHVPLEDVQYLAGHSNPQTTQLYDRRRRRVTRNIVERISV